MEKLQKRLSVHALVFVFSSALLILLSRSELRKTLSLLRWAAETNFGIGRLLRTDPRFLLVPGIFLLLFFAALLAAIGCVRCFLNIARLTAQGESYDPAPARDPEMQKYLRQLDDQLKSGLIDRAEYRALREKYERMRERDGR